MYQQANNCQCEHYLWCN